MEYPRDPRMTTSNTGQPISVDTRLASIFSRYGPDHVVHRSIRAAEPQIRATVAAVEERLDAVRR